MADRTLYHGDNLAFLRGMNSGTVNLIATGPPFNKSRDLHQNPCWCWAGNNALIWHHLKGNGTPADTPGLDATVILSSTLRKI